MGNDYTSEYIQAMNRYNDLLCAVVGKAELKVTDGKKKIRFDCKAIRDWLYRNEPDVMQAWEILREKEQEGKQ